MSVAAAEHPPKAESSPPPRRWSPARVAQTVVLGLWAGLFWYLLVSGRSLLYVSTRTQWVVPVGAVVLTLATIGRLFSARTRTPERIARREGVILLLMVIPVIVTVAAPPASLNSYASSRRSSFVRAGVTVSAADIASGPLTLVDISSSPATELGKEALAKRAGDTVSFIGIVTRYPDTPADEFLLTRYVITCCVADATVAQVRVVDVTPGEWAQDEWVNVTGTFYPIGDENIVDARRVTKVPEPSNPYLTP